MEERRIEQELSPLEALEKLRQNNKDNSHMFDDELLDIIESALKEYAGFQIVFKLSNRNEGKMVYDKLKVLKIIKDKFVFNEGMYGSLISQKLPITKEEYELLKEVLK